MNTEIMALGERIRKFRRSHVKAMGTNTQRKASYALNLLGQAMEERDEETAYRVAKAMLEAGQRAFHGDSEYDCSKCEDTGEMHVLDTSASGLGSMPEPCGECEKGATLAREAH